MDGYGGPRRGTAGQGLVRHNIGQGLVRTGAAGSAEAWLGMEFISPYLRHKLRSVSEAEADIAMQREALPRHGGIVPKDHPDTASSGNGAPHPAPQAQRPDSPVGTAALAGGGEVSALPPATKRPLIVDEPQPGFYRCKLVKGGPWVGISIFWAAPLDPWDGSVLDRSPILRCVVNGQMADPYEIWTRCAGEPITEDQFHQLRQQALSPDGQPSNQPINLNNVKPLGF